MQDEKERTVTEFDQNARHLSEAVEKQQAASRETIHWQGVLDKTCDRNSRQYFEGLVKLSTLEALHYNLVARSCERDGRQEPSKLDKGSKDHPVVGGPANQVKPSLEIALIEKGRNRALAEYHAHDAKAEAFSLLGELYRELGKEETARAYHDRARLQSAAARGFAAAIKGYDKKLENLGMVEQVSPEIRSSFRTLEQAARHLNNYNGGPARVRNHIRRVLANENEIRKLQAACERLPQTAIEHELLKGSIDRGEKIKRLAETEALEAAASYKNFRDEIESAEKAYDILSRTLTGISGEAINASLQRAALEDSDHSQTLQDAQADPEGSGRPVAETTISHNAAKEPEIVTSQAGESNSNRLAASERGRRLITGAVLSKILNELDHEL